MTNQPRSLQPEQLGQLTVCTPAVPQRVHAWIIWEEAAAGRPGLGARPGRHRHFEDPRPPGVRAPRVGSVRGGVHRVCTGLPDLTRVLGPDVPVTLAIRGNLAHSLGWSGRVDEAITAFERLQADLTRVLGPDAPDTLAIRKHLTYFLARSGRVDEAISALEQPLTDRTRVLGPDARDTLITRGDLAYWLEHRKI